MQRVAPAEQKKPDRPLVNPNTSVCLEGNPAGKIEVNWDG